MTESRQEYIVRKSKQALDHVYIDFPGQLELFSILGSYQIAAKEKVLKSSLAKILIRGNNAIITVNSESTNEHRKRFSIAHELGHYFLHQDLKSLFEDTEESCVHRYNNKGLEKEADQFAAEFLMPREIFKSSILGSKYTAPNFYLVKELSDIFNVSLSAAAIRLFSMNIYSGAIVVAVENVIRWFSSDGGFPFYVNTNRALNPSCLAGRFFKNGQVSEESETMDAQVWFPRVSGDRLIEEHTIYLPRWNMTYSLLWDPEDIV